MLKYLFTAEFAGGKLYDQSEDDKSVTDPETRSAFYDVMERIKAGDKLVGFHLIDQVAKYQLTVNLTNGLFYLNGFPFNVSDEYNHLEKGELTDYEVIYFRKPRQHLTQTIDNKTGQVISSSKTSELTFRLGWKAKDKEGNVVQRVIEIA